MNDEAMRHAAEAKLRVLGAVSAVLSEAEADAILRRISDVQTALAAETKRRAEAERERDNTRTSAEHWKGAKERAEADNAALRERLRALEETIGDISTRCEDKALRDLDPTNANTTRKLMRVIDAVHASALNALKVPRE